MFTQTKQVVLVNLNQIRVPPVAPYALDVLGSALVEAGFMIEVVDLTTTARSLEESLTVIDQVFGGGSPDAVVLSLRNVGDIYFPSFLDLPQRGSFLHQHEAIITRLKEHVGPEKILVGGVGFSGAPEALLARLGLYYGVRGPGENKIFELLNQILNNPTYSGKPIVLDGQNGSLQANVRRSFVDNAWYYRHGGLGNIRTSNGCGMNCAFCIEPFAKGNSFVRREIEDILREIDELVSLGVNDIHTVDSEFNLPFGHSKSVLNGIIERKYPAHVRFWAYCQPSPFDEEYARLLAEANFVGINFGTDHTDMTMLQTLGKWYTPDQIVTTTKLCNDNGIAVMHELLFGYLGDTPDKMYRAIDFLWDLDPRVIGVTIGFGVLPGTQLGSMYENRVKENKSLVGFYRSSEGKPLLDPTFFVDPSFPIPDIFDKLKNFVGKRVRSIMIPSLQSTSVSNNQLVDSERVRRQLESGLKGPIWYHYPKDNTSSG